MKRFLIFIFLLSIVAVASGVGFSIKHPPQGIQSVVPDSGAKTIYWFPAYDMSEVMIASDSTFRRNPYTAEGSRDSIRLAYHVDSWARTRVTTTKLSGQCWNAMQLFWSTQPISPFDTLYGVCGYKFVVDSSTVDTVISSLNAYPTLTQFSGVKIYGAKELQSIPSYLWIKVWQIDSIGTHLLSVRSNTVYSAVRFWKVN